MTARSKVPFRQLYEVKSSSFSCYKRRSLDNNEASQTTAGTKEAFQTTALRSKTLKLQPVRTRRFNQQRNFLGNGFTKRGSRATDPTSKSCQTTALQSEVFGQQPSRTKSPRQRLYKTKFPFDSFTKRGFRNRKAIRDDRTLISLLNQTRLGDSVFVEHRL